MHDWRGVVSSIPYSNRGGYQGPVPGWLERRGDGEYLVIGLAGGAGTATAYPPGRYMVAHAPGCNLYPRAGVRDPANAAKWLIQPETVVVDFLGGYAGHPVILTAAYAANEAEVDPYLVNAEGDNDRVSAHFTAYSTAGDVAGEVKVEACAGGLGGFTVTASEDVQVVSSKENISLTAKKNVTIAGAKVALGPNGDTSAPGVVRKGDAVRSAMADDSVFWTWLATAGTALAALGVAVPIPTSLTAKTTGGSGTVLAED